MGLEWQVWYRIVLSLCLFFTLCLSVGLSLSVSLLSLCLSICLSLSLSLSSAVCLHVYMYTHPSTTHNYTQHSIPLVTLDLKLENTANTEKWIPIVTSISNFGAFQWVYICTYAHLRRERERDRQTDGK